MSGAATSPGGTFRLSIPPGTYRLIVSLQSYDQRSGRHRGRGREHRGHPDPARSKPIQLKGVQVRGQQNKGTEASRLRTRRRRRSSRTRSRPSRSARPPTLTPPRRSNASGFGRGGQVRLRARSRRALQLDQVNGPAWARPSRTSASCRSTSSPTGSLDKIVVQKSYTPDRTASSRAAWSASTRDEFPGNGWSRASRSATARTGWTLDLGYDGGARLPRFDDGTRELPNRFPEIARARRLAPGALRAREEIQADRPVVPTPGRRKRDAQLQLPSSYAGVSTSSAIAGYSILVIALVLQRLREPAWTGQHAPTSGCDETQNPTYESR